MCTVIKVIGKTSRESLDVDWSEMHTLKDWPNGKTCIKDEAKGLGARNRCADLEREADCRGQ